MKSLLFFDKFGPKGVDFVLAGLIGGMLLLSANLAGVTLWQILDSNSILIEGWQPVAKHTIYLVVLMPWCLRLSNHWSASKEDEEETPFLFRWIVNAGLYFGLGGLALFTLPSISAHNANAAALAGIVVALILMRVE